MKQASDKKITLKAQKLLNYLDELSRANREEKKLIVAHWTGAPANPAKVLASDVDEAFFTFREMEEFYLQTGKKVGMMECWTECSWVSTTQYDAIEDLMWYTSMKRGISDLASKGGIIKIGSSFFAPTEEGYQIRNYLQVDYDKMMTLGTRTHENFWRLVDRTAELFSYMAEKDIPFLYRPFTESYLNKCFWYDSGMPDQVFIELWRELYHYLTEEKGLHNILWDFNGDRTSSKYPGDEYVDLFHGKSVYRDMHVEKEAGNSLPFAQGELGYQADYWEWLQKLKKESPESAYVLVWDRGWGPRGHEVYGSQIKNHAQGKEFTAYQLYNESYNRFLTDPYVITLDDLDWEKKGR